MSDGLRKHFDTSLKTLQKELLSMFEEVYDVYEELFNALKHQDKSAAEKIIENDKYINEMEVSINDICFILILKQCPVASDLRKIITAIKIASDLERIADYVVNVATYLIKTKHDNAHFVDKFLSYKNPLLNMFKLIQTAVMKNTLEDAFKASDIDNRIDALYKEHIKLFIDITKTQTDSVAEEASRAILVIKQFERAGDHVTNIAEQLIFFNSGKQLDLN